MERFEQWLWVPAWSRVMRVVVYGKRMRHRTAKNYQLDLFDLVRAMQAGTAERRSTNRKRRAIRPFQTIQTLCCGFINRAGLLVHPGGRQILDVGSNPMVRERFKTIESTLNTDTASARTAPR